MTSELFLPTDAFIRSVGTHQAAQYSLLLGAGASVSSGVLSADQCLWRWKRDIVISNNPGLEGHFTELSLASVRERIQDWLDAEGCHPGSGTKGEYEHYAAQAYPIAEDRRQFFTQLVEQALPNTGYQHVCLLAQSGVFHSVWTTNFDGLVGRAGAMTGTTVLEIGIDSSSRLERSTKVGVLRQISLHGDYRYDALKNTANELQDRDRSLLTEFAESLRDGSLIVVGYSARDESIMDTLAEAYATAGSGRLFWCTYGDEQPSPEVARLINGARSSGREAHIVKTDGFDDIMLRLSRFVLEGELHDRAARIVSSTSRDDETPTPFRVTGSTVKALLKSNAFPIELPGELLQVDAVGYDSPGAWARLKTRVSGHDVVAGLVKRKVLALGLMSDVMQAFRDQLQGDIVRTPLPDWELAGNTVVQSLLTQAFVRAISATRGFETDERALLWLPDKAGHRFVEKSQYGYYEATLVALRRYNNKSFVLLKPTIRVVDGVGQRTVPEIEREVKRQVLGKQWNTPFNEALNRWRDAILGGSAEAQFEFPPSSGSRVTFRLGRVPEAAQIRGPQSIRPRRVPGSLKRLLTQEGTEYQEPALVFSTGQGSGRVRDPHPIRGLIQNRPYDYSLTASGLHQSTRIGVIAPSVDAQEVTSFLAGLFEKAEPQTKQEYLLTFPGFTTAFGTSLDLPRPGMSGWVSCDEPSAVASDREGAHAIRRELQRRVDELQSTYDPHCVLIYIPTRWASWEQYTRDDEHFDLHDFLKAYCIERGVATQFLRERTTAKRQRTEIMWWLALSFYVKSRRTPWILQGLDNDTAFAGLGFSVDPTAPKGKHVLLGCSHIYNAEGLGLSYRLSTLANSRMRHRDNPFLDREDARRMGENIRELFFDAHGKLPERVVIHKRTPYRDDEKHGLIEGLAGVDQIEMIEINVDNVLRYVASRPSGQSFSVDGYPVRRGSAIVLEANQALLWIHGSADPVGDGRNPYYQGKSRIPAPLVLRRYYGRADLQRVALEILGLSKMNWNTFDLYSKFPATVESSNAIARIGALLERFGPRSYDYRLFI